MKREIKFRGRKKYGDGFVYGDLVSYGQFKSIRCSTTYTEIPIHEYSVGQFTGLKDKDGIEIYEGDIVEVDKEPWKVYYHNSDACFKISHKLYPTNRTLYGNNHKIIGTIPEKIE